MQYCNSLNYDLSVGSSRVWNINSDDVIIWICNEPWVGSISNDGPTLTFLYFTVGRSTTVVVDPVQSQILVPVVNDLKVDFW